MPREPPVMVLMVNILAEPLNRGAKMRASAEGQMDDFVILQIVPWGLDGMGVPGLLWGFL